MSRRKKKPATPVHATVAADPRTPATCRACEMEGDPNIDLFEALEVPHTCPWGLKQRERAGLEPAVTEPFTIVELDEPEEKP